MLSPNTRANTVISQSFIASQFQGFTDPFVNSNPRSSLTQFVKSKQTSDSGIIQGGQNHSFGFGNITSNHEPKKLQSFSRKPHEVQHVNGVVNQNNQNNQNRNQNQNNQNVYQPPGQANYTQMNNVNQQQVRVNPQVQPQQQQMVNERYISPGMVKTDSPVKMNQFVPPPQQRPAVIQQQPVMNVQPMNNQPKQTQQISTQQQQKSPTSQKNFPSYNNPNSQKQIIQGSKKLISNQQQQMMSSNVGEPSIGKRLKLNVSQEFSDSFTLNCVNQPQRTVILQMKKRQRQYRKGLQNFFM